MSHAFRTELAKRKTSAYWQRIHASAAACGDRNPAAVADRALDLASHAALAVALDARLLNLIRVNFFVDGAALPYWTESPLLLSSLCREEGDGLFVMDGAVRDVLLTRLASEHGTARVRQMASLLWQYAEREPSWADRRELRHAQQVTALNFLEPGRARDWLEQAQLGAGDDTLSKEWFVAMNAELPALPQIASEAGDPQAVCDALMELGFEEQVQKWRELKGQSLHDGGDLRPMQAGRANQPDEQPGTSSEPLPPFVTFIQGPPGSGHLWLLYRLLRIERAAALFEMPLTAQMSQTDAFVRGLTDTMGTPFEARWLPAIERLVDAARPGAAAVLAFIGAQNMPPRVLSPLIPDVVGLIHISQRNQFKHVPTWLVLLGSVASATALDERAVSLPSIRPLIEREILGWVEAHRGLLRVNIEPQFAKSILDSTGGLPERVFERLCVACGVRWREVLTRARAPFAPTSTTASPLMHLAGEYDAIRTTLPQGQDRTARMEAIVAAMRIQTRDLSLNALHARMEHSSAGARLTAIVALQMNPLADCVTWLVERLGTEKPFIEYHASVALTQAALRLDATQLVGVDNFYEKVADCMRRAGPVSDRTRELQLLLKVLRTRLAEPPTPQVLLVIPTHERVVLPGETTVLTVSSADQLGALSRAHEAGHGIFVLPLVQAGKEEIGPTEIGTLCSVTQVMVADKTHAAVRVKSIERGRLAPFLVLGNEGLAAVEAYHDDATPVPRTLKSLIERLSVAPPFFIRPAGDSGHFGPQLLPDQDDSLAAWAYSAARLLNAPPNLAAYLLRASGALEKQSIVESMLHASLTLLKVDKLEAGLRGHIRNALVASSNKMLRALAVKFATTPRLLNDNAPQEARTQPLRGKLWPIGKTVRVSLSGGSPPLQQRVKQTALEWTKHANIRFEFVGPNSKPPAEIRVSFTENSASWSCIGTDALDIAHDRPTMNLAWIDADTSAADLHTMVLRQFGCALGLIPEHQSPNSDVKWNRAAVIAALSKPPNSWNRSKFEDTYFLTVPIQDYRAFDPHSIMMFEIPAEWTLDHVAYGYATELSESDKRFIAKLYPRTGSPHLKQRARPHKRGKQLIKKSVKKSAKKK